MKIVSSIISLATMLSSASIDSAIIAELEVSSERWNSSGFGFPAELLPRFYFWFVFVRVGSSKPHLGSEISSSLQLPLIVAPASVNDLEERALKTTILQW